MWFGIISPTFLQPELIPDPIANSESLVVKVRKMPSRTAIGRRLLDLGSDVDHCGIITAIVQVATTDVVDGGLQTKISPAQDNN